MKLIIFGATGTLGRHIVTLALEQKHKVTAFSRNPSILKLEHPHLTLRAGDVLDAAGVEIAVEDHDAVVIALGAGLTKATIRSVGSKHVIDAMQRHGVRRLICLSSLGAGDSRGNLNLFWKHIMFGLLLHRAMADHNAQEAFVKKSNLDWTIVRPRAFTDGQQPESINMVFRRRRRI